MLKYILLTFCISLAAANVVIPTPNEAVGSVANCKVPCSTKPSKPVCVFDGKAFDVLTSECDLLITNCTSGYKLQTMKMSDCLTSKTYDMDCDFPCPEDSEPVCGRGDFGISKLFKNTCYLVRESCKDKIKYRRIESHLCKRSETMDNENKNLNKKNNNKHKKENNNRFHEEDSRDYSDNSVMDNCQRPCPANYDPKCAYNGHEYIVFGNECEYEVAKCLEPHGWKTVRMSMCDKKRVNKKPDGPPHKKKPHFNEYEDDHFAATAEEEEGSAESEQQGGSWENEERIQESEQEHISMEEMPDVEVEPSVEEECPVVCKRIFRPVCGFDGKKFKIFSNECLLRKEKCDKSGNWKEIKMPECLKSSFAE